MKKCVVIMLLFAMLCSFAACGSKTVEVSYSEGEKKMQQSQYDEKYSEELDVYDDTGEIYTRELILTPDADICLMRAIRSYNYIFMYGVTGLGEQLLYKMDIESQQFEKIELPQQYTVQGMCAAAEGGINILYIGEENEYILLAVKDDGSRSEMTLPMLEEYKESLVTQIYSVENGYIVFTADRILALDKQGNQIKKIENFYRYGSCIQQENGNIILAINIMTTPNAQTPETRVLILDSNFDLLESYDSNRQFTLFLEDLDGDSKILCQSLGTLFRFDYKNDVIQPVIDMTQSGVSSASLIYLEDDQYFSLINGMPYFLRRDDGNSIITLTLAAYHLDYNLSNYISKYNDSSASYRIRIADYAMYDEDGTEGQGLNRLRADIIAGRTPDIYDLSQLPAELYAERGLFEDLKPYFSGDAPIQYDQLVQSAVKVLEYKGELYYIPPEFEAITVCGDVSFVGDCDTWTPQEFFDAVDSITPEDVFGPEITKTVFLSVLLQFLEDEYIDKENLTCYFDNADFLKFLEFAFYLPDECDYSTLDSQPTARAYVGRQPLLIRQIGSSAISFLSFTDTIFSGQAQYVGFPTNLSNGVALQPISLVSMSSTSQHKSGVMDFIYFLLNENIQRSVSCCPIVQSMLEEQMDLWQDQYLERTPVLYTFCDDVAVQIEGKTDLDTAKLRLKKIIESMDSTTLYDEAILDIIIRESQPYFIGAIPTEQAVSNIQSKVRVYLSEQYG